MKSEFHAVSVTFESRLLGPTTYDSEKQESPAVADKPATLAKSSHGLRKSSGVVSCIASLLIDSVPMVSYLRPSNCVCKMPRFEDIRLLKLPCP